MSIAVDLHCINDEDLLRQMWQETADFGRKKEIRAHMYKLRETRLRDFYSGDMDAGIGLTKTPLTGSHGDSLADQSFQSFKTKEIRDSESPTREFKYGVPSKTGGWNVMTSSELSSDGKKHTTHSLATTGGVHDIANGKATFAGKNEKLSSVMFDGDDKNFTTSTGHTSKTLLEENIATGDDNNKRLESNKSSTVSSSQVTSSKYTSEDDPAIKNHKNLKNEFDELMSTTTSDINKISSVNTREQNERFTNNNQIRTQNVYNEPGQNSRRPSYQEKDIITMAPGEHIISRTVEFPDNNTKVIKEVKSLPDGSTVTTTKYETRAATSNSWTNASNKKASSTSRVITEDHANRNRVEYVLNDNRRIITDDYDRKNLYSDPNIPPQSVRDDLNTNKKTIIYEDVRRFPDQYDRNQTNVPTYTLRNDPTNNKKNVVYDDHINTPERNQQIKTNTNIIRDNLMDIHDRRVEEDYVHKTVKKDLTDDMEKTKQFYNEKIIRVEPIDNYYPQNNDKPYYNPNENRPQVQNIPKSEIITTRTETRYVTQKQTENTRKRISVDLDPSHEAFARSLRCISPVSDRGSVRSHRTSTSSIRSSTSPDKRSNRSQSRETVNSDISRISSNTVTKSYIDITKPSDPRKPVVSGSRAPNNKNRPDTKDREKSVPKSEIETKKFPKDFKSSPKHPQYERPNSHVTDNTDKNKKQPVHSPQKPNNVTHKNILVTPTPTDLHAKKTNLLPNKLDKPKSGSPQTISPTRPVSDIDNIPEPERDFYIVTDLDSDDNTTPRKRSVVKNPDAEEFTDITNEKNKPNTRTDELKERPPFMRSETYEERCRMILGMPDKKDNDQSLPDNDDKFLPTDSRKLIENEKNAELRSRPDFADNKKPIEKSTPTGVKTTHKPKVDDDFEVDRTIQKSPIGEHGRSSPKRLEDHLKKKPHTDEPRRDPNTKSTIRKTTDNRENITTKNIKDITAKVVKKSSPRSTPDVSPTRKPTRSDSPQKIRIQDDEDDQVELVISKSLHRVPVDMRPVSTFEPEKKDQKRPKPGTDGNTNTPNTYGPSTKQGTAGYPLKPGADPKKPGTNEYPKKPGTIVHPKKPDSNDNTETFDSETIVRKTINERLNTTTQNLRETTKTIKKTSPRSSPDASPVRKPVRSDSPNKPRKYDDVDDEQEIGKSTIITTKQRSPMDKSPNKKQEPDRSAPKHTDEHPQKPGTKTHPTTPGTECYPKKPGTVGQPKKPYVDDTTEVFDSETIIRQTTKDRLDITTKNLREDTKIVKTTKQTSPRSSPDASPERKPMRSDSPNKPRGYNDVDDEIEIEKVTTITTKQRSPLDKSPVKNQEPDRSTPKNTDGHPQKPGTKTHSTKPGTDNYPKKPQTVGQPKKPYVDDTTEVFDSETNIRQTTKDRLDITTKNLREDTKIVKTTKQTSPRSSPDASPERKPMRSDSPNKPRGYDDIDDEIEMEKVTTITTKQRSPLDKNPVKNQEPAKLAPKQTDGQPQKPGTDSYPKKPGTVGQPKKPYVDDNTEVFDSETIIRKATKDSFDITTNKLREDTKIVKTTKQTSPRSSPDASPDRKPVRSDSPNKPRGYDDVDDWEEIEKSTTICTKQKTPLDKSPVKKQEPEKSAPKHTDGNPQKPGTKTYPTTPDTDNYIKKPETVGQPKNVDDITEVLDSENITRQTTKDRLDITTKNLREDTNIVKTTKQTSPRSSPDASPERKPVRSDSPKKPKEDVDVDDWEEIEKSTTISTKQKSPLDKSPVKKQEPEKSAPKHTDGHPQKPGTKTHPTTPGTECYPQKPGTVGQPKKPYVDDTTEVFDSETIIRQTTKNRLDITTKNLREDTKIVKTTRQTSPRSSPDASPERKPMRSDSPNKPRGYDDVDDEIEIEKVTTLTTKQRSPLDKNPVKKQEPAKLAPQQTDGQPQKPGTDSYLKKPGTVGQPKKPYVDDTTEVFDSETIIRQTTKDRLDITTKNLREDTKIVKTTKQTSPRSSPDASPERKPMRSDSPNKPRGYDDVDDEIEIEKITNITTKQRSPLDKSPVKNQEPERSAPKHTDGHPQKPGTKTHSTKPGTDSYPKKPGTVGQPKKPYVDDTTEVFDSETIIRQTTKDRLDITTKNLREDTKIVKTTKQTSPRSSPDASPERKPVRSDSPNKQRAYDDGDDEIEIEKVCTITTKQRSPLDKSPVTNQEPDRSAPKHTDGHPQKTGTKTHSTKPGTDSYPKKPETIGQLKKPYVDDTTEVFDSETIIRQTTKDRLDITTKNLREDTKIVKTTKQTSPRSSPDASPERKPMRSDSPNKPRGYDDVDDEIEIEKVTTITTKQRSPLDKNPVKKQEPAKLAPKQTDGQPQKPGTDSYPKKPGTVSQPKKPNVDDTTEVFDFETNIRQTTKDRLDITSKNLREDTKIVKTTKQTSPRSSPDASPERKPMRSDSPNKPRGYDDVDDWEEIEKSTTISTKQKTPLDKSPVKNQEPDRSAPKHTDGHPQKPGTKTHPTKPGTDSYPKKPGTVGQPKKPYVDDTTEVFDSETIIRQTTKDRLDIPTKNLREDTKIVKTTKQTSPRSSSDASPDRKPVRSDSPNKPRGYDDVDDWEEIEKSTTISTKQKTPLDKSPVKNQEPDRSAPKHTDGHPQKPGTKTHPTKPGTDSCPKKPGTVGQPKKPYVDDTTEVFDSETIIRQTTKDRLDITTKNLREDTKIVKTTKQTSPRSSPDASPDRKPVRSDSPNKPRGYDDVDDWEEIEKSTTISTKQKTPLDKSPVKNQEPDRSAPKHTDGHPQKPGTKTHPTKPGTDSCPKKPGTVGQPKKPYVDDTTEVFDSETIIRQTTKDRLDITTKNLREDTKIVKTTKQTSPRSSPDASPDRKPMRSDSPNKPRGYDDVDDEIEIEKVTTITTKQRSSLDKSPVKNQEPDRSAPKHTDGHPQKPGTKTHPTKSGTDSYPKKPGTVGQPKKPYVDNTTEVFDSETIIRQKTKDSLDITTKNLREDTRIVKTTNQTSPRSSPDASPVRRPMRSGSPQKPKDYYEDNNEEFETTTTVTSTQRSPLNKKKPEPERSAPKRSDGHPKKPDTDDVHSRKTTVRKTTDERMDIVTKNLTEDTRTVTSPRSSTDSSPVRRPLRSGSPQKPKEYYEDDDNEEFETTTTITSTQRSPLNKKKPEPERPAPTRSDGHPKKPDTDNVLSRTTTVRKTTDDRMDIVTKNLKVDTRTVKTVKKTSPRSSPDSSPVRRPLRLGSPHKPKEYYEDDDNEEFETTTTITSTQRSPLNKRKPEPKRPAPTRSDGHPKKPDTDNVVSRTTTVRKTTDDRMDIVTKNLREDTRTVKIVKKSSPRSSPDSSPVRRPLQSGSPQKPKEYYEDHNDEFEAATTVTSTQRSTLNKKKPEPERPAPTRPDGHPKKPDNDLSRTTTVRKTTDDRMDIVTKNLKVDTRTVKTVKKTSPRSSPDSSPVRRPLRLGSPHKPKEYYEDDDNEEFETTTTITSTHESPVKKLEPERSAFKRTDVYPQKPETNDLLSRKTIVRENTDDRVDMTRKTFREETSSFKITKKSSPRSSPDTSPVRNPLRSGSPHQPIDSADEDEEFEKTTTISSLRSPLNKNAVKKREPEKSGPKRSDGFTKKPDTDNVVSRKTTVRKTADDRVDIVTKKEDTRTIKIVRKTSPRSSPDASPVRKPVRSNFPQKSIIDEDKDLKQMTVIKSTRKLPLGNSPVKHQEPDRFTPRKDDQPKKKPDVNRNATSTVRKIISDFTNINSKNVKPQNTIKIVKKSSPRSSPDTSPIRKPAKTYSRPTNKDDEEDFEYSNENITTVRSMRRLSRDNNVEIKFEKSTPRSSTDGSPVRKSKVLKSSLKPSDSDYDDDETEYLTEDTTIVTSTKRSSLDKSPIRKPSEPKISKRGDSKYAAVKDDMNPNLYDTSVIIRKVSNDRSDTIRKNLRTDLNTKKTTSSDVSPIKRQPGKNSLKPRYLDNDFIDDVDDDEFEYLTENIATTVKSKPLRQEVIEEPMVKKNVLKNCDCDHILPQTNIERKIFSKPTTRKPQTNNIEDYIIKSAQSSFIDDRKPIKSNVTDSPKHVTTVKIPADTRKSTTVETKKILTQKNKFDNVTETKVQSKKLPVTERKNTAPVYGSNKIEMVNKIGRSTSDQLLKTSTLTVVPSSKKVKPKIEVYNANVEEPDDYQKSPQKSKRPIKCITTKTINISDKLYTDEMDNIVIDFEQAKSSREPTPNKIIPIPVSPEEDTGPSRFPDQISEPDDELPKYKKQVRNIPIYEEETSDYIGCNITEVGLEYDSETETSHITDMNRVTETDECLLSVSDKVTKFNTAVNNVTTTKTNKQNQYIIEIDHSNKDLRNDDCLLSVSDKVNKFISTVEEIKKPKTSTPFKLDTRPKTEIEEPDNASLSVTEKVTKFISVSEDIETPREPFFLKMDKQDVYAESVNTYMNKEAKYSKKIQDTETLNVEVQRKTPDTKSVKNTKSHPHGTTTTQKPDKKQINEDFISTEKISTRRNVADRYKPNTTSNTISSSPITLKSTEIIKKAKAVFENKNKTGLPKQRDIESRPSVWKHTPMSVDDKKDVKLTDIGIHKSKKDLQSDTLKSKNLKPDQHKKVIEEKYLSTSIDNTQYNKENSSTEDRKYRIAKKDIFEKSNVVESTTQKKIEKLTKNDIENVTQYQTRNPSSSHRYEDGRDSNIVETITTQKKIEKLPKNVTDNVTRYQKETREQISNRRYDDGRDSNIIETITTQKKIERLPKVVTENVTRYQKEIQEPSSNRRYDDGRDSDTDESIPSRENDRNIPSYMSHTVSSYEHINRNKGGSPDRTTSESQSLDGESNNVPKFGVDLKRVESNSIRRKSSSAEIPCIEEIFDINLLEKMLETVVGYEQRRRIRSQIRIVKRQIQESNDDNEVRRQRQKSPLGKPLYSETSGKPSQRTPATKSKHESLVVVKQTIETQNLKKELDNNRLKQVKSSSPASSPKSNLIRKDKPEETKSIVKDRDNKDDKPIWATKNILKKPSESPRTVKTYPKKVEKITKVVTERDPKDSITSCYGIGPTDEMGRPLFGIRALKKSTQQSEQLRETSVDDDTPDTTFHTSYTTITTERKSPREIREKLFERENSRKSFRNESSSSNTVDEVEVQEESYSSKYSPKTIRTVRRGSVKELSEKFISKEVSVSENNSYQTNPTSETTRTTKYRSSRESTPASGYENEEYVQTDENQFSQQKHYRTEGKQTKSFLGSDTKVTGFNDVIERMQNADNVEVDGDTEEDREARALLNKFLGASMLISATETVLPREITTVTTSSSGPRQVTTTKITKTFKTSSAPEEQQQLYAKTYNNIEEIWDERILKKILDEATSYEERKRVRAQIRHIMAEKEACAEIVASVTADLESEKSDVKDIQTEGSDDTNEDNKEEETGVLQGTTTTKVTKETKGNDASVTKTTTTVTTRTVSAVKPVSPFAKFRQLDKQNSVQSPPKSPQTPTTPLFTFTDPALGRRAATVKDQLLQWCQMKTSEYENVKITNFSTSWTDGLAFCALIHHFLPDAFDYKILIPQQRRHNFELAFRVADEKAGIAPLLDVEDMVVMRKPDWKCVFTYVQSIHRRFKASI